MSSQWKLMKLGLLGSLIVCLTLMYIQAIATNRTQGSHMFSSHVELELSRALNLSEHQDRTGQYKIVPFVSRGKQWTQLSQKPLCVATQGTLEYAHKILNIVENWPGAVSVTLWTPGPEFTLALKYLNYLRLCYPAVANQVSVHLIYPEILPPTEVQLNITTSCQMLPDDVLQVLLSHSSVEARAETESQTFPKNLMRNVANQNCPSEFVTCLDIDILFPTPDIAEPLENFFKSVQKCDKCVYIMPVYEIDEYSDLPRNKAELIDLIRNEGARPYHALKPACQKSTNYSRWLKLPLTESIGVAYEVPATFTVEYEPFYIASRNVLPFDERFHCFMDRNTQFFEMKLAGYKFYVLDNLFVNHMGFAGSFFSPVRTFLTSRSFEYFCEYFVKELSKKYNVDLETIRCGL